MNETIYSTDCARSLLKALGPFREFSTAPDRSVQTLAPRQVVIEATVVGPFGMHVFGATAIDRKQP